MRSNMDIKEHQRLTRRTVELGRSADPNSLDELTRLLRMPSSEIRRLAASAIAKLSGLGADPNKAVAALAPVALGDPHPQVQQYALKAVKTYGAAASKLLDQLDDLADSPAHKEYVRQAAHSAAAAIRQAIQHREEQSERRCERCDRHVDLDEYQRSTRVFQRVYCDKCFDETCVKRRNFETSVENKKNIKVVDGTLVQSDGERRVAEWLAKHHIAYRYDGRLRIIEGFQIRPDFYLPEFDVYIEYWGLDTPRYKAGMYVKQDLYMHTGKKLVSIYPEDKPRLDQVLTAKLAQYGGRPAATSETSQPINSKGKQP